MKHRRNGALRKRCRCARKAWPTCPHAWHLRFKWRGTDYRIALDETELGTRIDSFNAALDAADRVRIAIRAGTWRAAPAPEAAPAPVMTFEAFAKTWQARHGHQLVSAPLDSYRLKTIFAFVVPGTDPAVTLGSKALAAITTDDIEAFRDFRKARKLSAVAVNQDLQLLRKMFNWAVRKGYLATTPFKRGTEPAISLEREIPRNKRLPDAESEQRLLNAARPHLRGVITAMLDTACRPGEILSLQWRDVSLERKELTIRAEKEKTRRERIIPISARLLALLELRRTDPAGEPFGPDAYVFGNELGERVKSVQGAWTTAAANAGLTDFQLRDLRHEAASRFDEAGMPIVYVSTMLGHSNISTTSRYLNINRRGLHLAMQQYEQKQRAQIGHKPDGAPLAAVPGTPAAHSSKPSVQ
jgi:integrase